MARKKSTEELMLEAELSGASDRAGVRQELPRGGVALPVEALREPDDKQAAKARRRVSPKAIAIAAIAIVAIVLAVWLVSRIAFSNSTDVWDGTADKTWYHEGMSAMSVTTAEQLAGMRELCNEGVTLEGIRFRLERNLDLYEIPTKPIGDGRNDQGKTLCFKGSFDGAGHTISGINIEEDTWDHAGLFGSVDDGDIKDLTVEGRVTGQVRVGGVVGEMSGGSLTNCTNRCKVSSLKTATSYYPVTADVGGVCGIWLGIAPSGVERAELSGLVNEGDVSARATSAGGVIGTIANTDGFTVNVRHLENRAGVTVYCESEERDEAVGGVVGVIGSYGTTKVSDLVNDGDVSCSTVLGVGGVFGAIMAPQATVDDAKANPSQGIAVKGCVNRARIVANAQDERAHVGGMVGYLDDPDVVFEDCENTGELAATNGNADEICATNGAEVWDEWEDAHPKYLY